MSTGAKWTLASRCVMSLASARHRWLQPQPERTASEARASCRTTSVVLVNTVPSSRPLRLSSGNAERPAESVALKHAYDTDPDGSAARQAPLFTLKTLCCSECVSPPETVSDGLLQARERLAQLGRVRTELNTPKTEQQASQTALSAAVEIPHDAIEGLLCQQRRLCFGK